MAKEIKKDTEVNTYVHLIHHEGRGRKVIELGHGTWQTDGKKLNRLFRDAIEDVMREHGFSERKITEVRWTEDIVSITSKEVSGTHSAHSYDDEFGHMHVICTDALRIGKRIDSSWDEVVICFPLF